MGYPTNPKGDVSTRHIAFFYYFQCEWQSRNADTIIVDGVINAFVVVN